MVSPVRVGVALALCLWAPALSARSVVVVADAPVQALPRLATGWSATAVSLRGQAGAQAVVDCPPGGRPGSVWGVGSYTDDSSICTAAVHAGLIGLAGGGRVVFEIRAGQASYPGSTQHGITTGSWAAWHGSFVLVSASRNPAPPQVAAPAGTVPVGWSDDTAVLSGAAAVAVHCPPGGSAGRLWGSGLYTDDSSLCTAGVHAGVIGFAQGGIVRIELRPGQPSYAGTTRNGVRSSPWAAWSGSFVVLGGTAPLPPPTASGPRTLAWSDDATGLGGQLGQRIDLVCPAGGTPGTVWGSGTYTDDSSICTAAVHAGRITLAAGGKVTVELLPGQPSYLATTAHGVTTLAYGVWTGSFRVR